MWTGVGVRSGKFRNWIVYFPTLHANITLSVALNCTKLIDNIIELLTLVNIHNYILGYKHYFGVQVRACVGINLVFGPVSEASNELT